MSLRLGNPVPEAWICSGERPQARKDCKSPQWTIGHVNPLAAVWFPNCKNIHGLSKIFQTRGKTFITDFSNFVAILFSGSEQQRPHWMTINSYWLNLLVLEPWITCCIENVIPTVWTSSSRKCQSEKEIRFARWHMCDAQPFHWSKTQSNPSNNCLPSCSLTNCQSNEGSYKRWLSGNRGGNGNFHMRMCINIPTDIPLVSMNMPLALQCSSRLCMARNLKKNVDCWSPSELKYDEGQPICWGNSQKCLQNGGHSF